MKRKVRIVKCGYGIYQAEKLGEKGIGLKYATLSGALTVFSTKLEAREWLAGLIKQIKYEQSIGERSKDNLNKKEKLDFYIGKVFIVASKEAEREMKKRGWDFKANDRFNKKLKKLSELQRHKKNISITIKHIEEVKGVGIIRKIKGFMKRWKSTH